MAERRTVAVVGAGVIGSAIAWHALRSGDWEVLLLDTHLPLVGATGYSAGILRRHHTLSTDIALAAESLIAYRSLSAELGHPVGYTEQGFLLILGPESASTAAIHRQVIDAAGSRTEWLDTDVLAERYPYLSLADGEFGVLESDGGYGSPPSTAQAYRLAFAAQGGTSMVGVQVAELAPKGDQWLLRTNIGELQVDAVVLAAGAQCARLVAPIGLELPVTPRRIGLAVTRPAAELPRCPVVIDDVSGTYFVPRTDGTVAVGVRARPECQTVLPAEPLTEAEIAEAIDRGRRRVPAFADSRVLGSQAACDGYTPDNRPILGRVSELPGLHLACGFSGGGYKIAPAVGKHVAAGVIDDGPVPEPIAAYNLQRFASGALLRSNRAYEHL